MRPVHGPQHGGTRVATQSPSPHPLAPKTRIPMAIGAAGGEANAPLARTIIGGVLAATILSLVVVPCLYVMFMRDSRETATALPVGA